MFSREFPHHWDHRMGPNGISASHLDRSVPKALPILPVVAWGVLWKMCSWIYMIYLYIYIHVLHIYILMIKHMMINLWSIYIYIFILCVFSWYLCCLLAFWGGLKQHSGRFSVCQCLSLTYVCPVWGEGAAEQLAIAFSAWYQSAAFLWAQHWPDQPTELCGNLW